MKRDSKDGISKSLDFIVPWVKNIFLTCNNATDRDAFYNLMDKESIFKVTMQNDGVLFESLSDEFITEGYFWEAGDFVIAVKGKLLYAGFVVIVSPNGISVKDDHEVKPAELASVFKQEFEDSFGLIRKAVKSK